MEVILNDNEDIDELDKILEKQNLDDIHNNEINKLYNKDFKAKKTPKYLTLYEYTAIIGKRAGQIQDNAPILINNYNKNDSAIKIAEKELQAGVIPIIIRRPLPDGSYEDVNIKELFIKNEY